MCINEMNSLYNVHKIIVLRVFKSRQTLDELCNRYTDHLGCIVSLLQQNLQVQAHIRVKIESGFYLEAVLFLILNFRIKDVSVGQYSRCLCLSQRDQGLSQQVSPVLLKILSCLSCVGKKPFKK